MQNEDREEKERRENGGYKTTIPPCKANIQTINSTTLLTMKIILFHSTYLKLEFVHNILYGVKMSKT